MKKSMSNKFVASLIVFVMALSLISFWGSNRVEAAPKKKTKVSKENIKAHKAYEKFIKGLKGGKSLLIYEDAKLKKLYFAYHDMDNDKIDELLLKVDENLYETGISYFLFKYNKGKVEKIDEFSEIIGIAIGGVEFGFDRNGIYEHSHYPNHGGGSVIFALKNGKVKEIYHYEYSVHDDAGNYYNEAKVTIHKTSKEGEKANKDKTRIKFLLVNKKNFKKYRNTYNSKGFKKTMKKSL